MSEKFDRDFTVVSTILAKDRSEISVMDRMQLLSIYQVSFHTSGKIEGIFSCDSSCSNCGFCQKMRAAAEKNPLHICGYCYDYAQESRWTNVKQRHGLNLEIMRSVEFTREELATLNIYGICRFNSSGDVDNVTQAKNYINIAYSHPFSRFALWAKNMPAVVAALDELGKPENLIVIQSSVIIGQPAARAKYVDYVFTVYHDEESMEKALGAGACECNGKKCADCGYKCYHGAWENGANIAEFLRLNGKKQREAVAAAITEKGV